MLRSARLSAESRRAKVAASAISTVSRSGVIPRASGRQTLAPAWTRRREAACWPLATAKWSGVIPAESLVASTFAHVHDRVNEKMIRHEQGGILWQTRGSAYIISSHARAEAVRFKRSANCSRNRKRCMPPHGLALCAPNIDMVLWRRLAEDSKEGRALIIIYPFR